MTVKIADVLQFVCWRYSIGLVDLCVTDKETFFFSFSSHSEIIQRPIK